MSIPPAWQQTFTFFDGPLVVQLSHTALSSDGGLLPLRPFDEHIASPQTFADALDYPREPELTEHSFREMVPRHRFLGKPLQRDSRGLESIVGVGADLQERAAWESSVSALNSRARIAF